MTTPRRPRSKTAATWIALVGGGLGLHRFYLHGWRDPWGWLHPLPFALGVYGLDRVGRFGHDDMLSWGLIPLLGVVVAASMLAAVVYGLTPDARWNERHNPRGAPSAPGGRAAVAGVLLAAFLGAGVLIATLAFAAQRYFELQTKS